MIMNTFTFNTPAGWMAGACKNESLRALVLPQVNKMRAMESLALELGIKTESVNDAGHYVGLAKLLIEEVGLYFNGERMSFSAAIDWSGYTPYQRKVLEIVKAIPYGEARTYGEVAQEAGNPRGARAVGGVMRANRTPLVIPCHRVLGTGGSLGGFSGGLELKKYLLNHENPSKE